MVEVAPSILAADFANLERDCRKVVSPETPWLHFDVMDGVFVPNISVGLPVLASLKKALPQARYDVHLMIQQPRLYVQRFVQAGADYVTFHCEADSPVVETARAIRAAGGKAGISLRPGTSVEQIFTVLAEFDLVLVMSVEPGFGGQSFMPQAVQRIAAIKAEAQRQGHSILIEVDGGIDQNTAPACVQAGAALLVAGSAVFGAQAPAKALWALRQAGQEEKA